MCQPLTFSSCETGAGDHRCLSKIFAHKKGLHTPHANRGVSAAGGGVTPAAAARGARASMGPAGAVCGAMHGRAGAGPLRGVGKRLKISRSEGETPAHEQAGRVEVGGKHVRRTGRRGLRVGRRAARCAARTGRAGVLAHPTRRHH